MQETQGQSLGWEHPLEREIATHFSILAWRIPMNRGAWWATVHGVTKSQTQLSNFHIYYSVALKKINRFEPNLQQMFNDWVLIKNFFFSFSFKEY